MTTTDTWRDYTFEPMPDGGVACLCRSDDICMDAQVNEDGRYLTLGEAYDWAQAHVAEHAKCAAGDEADRTPDPAQL